MKEGHRMKSFFMGMQEQLLVIREEEEGYRFSTPLKSIKSNQLAVHPENTDKLYLASDEGLWISEDKGETWMKNDFTFDDAARITSVAVHPKRETNGHSTIYVGTEPSRLYYSEDSGKTWREFHTVQELPSKSQWSFPPRPETHYIRWITPDESDPDYIAVSVEAGAVFFTNNHGITWNDRAENSPIDVHTLLKHPDDPTRLYAANGGLVHEGSQGSYAESHDSGHTWMFADEGLGEHRYLYNMALHPIDADYRLVSASESASKAHGSDRYSTVYEKIGNESWVLKVDGLPTNDAFTHHLTNDPSNINGFYALNNFGLFHLETGADTWEKVALPWSTRYENQRFYFFVVTD